MKIKYPILLLIMLLSMLHCEAKREPAWMKELPKPGNETYIYVRESGEGATVNVAMAQAMVRVFQHTANRLGQPFDARKVSDALISGTDYQVISKQYNVPVNRVGVYTIQLDNGKYWVYVLCQVAAMGNVEPVWESVGRTAATENLIAVAKSAVLPGLGQIGKEHAVEGILTMVGEAALVGGGIACYKSAQTQLGIMRAEGTSAVDFSAATDKYYSLQNASYFIWGMAGALYIFNIVRAITVHPKTPYELSFEPSIVSSPYVVAPTVGLTLRF